jgi:P-type E1-E2 ATPase
MSSIKDFVEDRKRRLADQEENESKVMVLNRKSRALEERLWEQLKVGDIIKVEKDHFFPADLLYISSFQKSSDETLLNKTSECYVQTKNLDGETNLKQKTSIFEVSRECFPDTNGIHPSDIKGLIDFKAEIQCEKPGTNIYKFDGVIKLR